MESFVSLLDARNDVLHGSSSTPVNGLAQRQANTGQELLCLISSPFASQLGGEAALASLVTSLVLASVMALLFCLIRPHNNVVYAPRAKHADSKHAPPPVSKNLFGWIPPVLRTKEQDLAEKVGLDAAVFMRVSKMLRNIFLIIAVIGCAILIPVNVLSNNSLNHGNTKRQSSGGNSGPDCFSYGGGATGASAIFLRLTPTYTFPGGTSWWAYVVTAYIFDGVIMFFLWTNYRAVLRLRRAYFDSPDYQRSLHARTLMLTDIPQAFRTDDGIVRLTEDTKATSAVPRAAIARNVKDLPDLVEEHEHSVRELEEHLAKYLKNPDKLPINRPMTTASKNDKGYSKGQKVDAIEYLTGRIRELEIEIKEVRESVDKRNALSYGFASYEHIPEAHSVAYATRKKAPAKTTIRLATKPNDLVWKNLKMTRKERGRQNMLNNFWIGVLTVIWIVPNVLIAVFLSNLNNIALLYPPFATTLQQHSGWFAIVQGVAAPAITTLFYYYLPAIFRRMSINAGDVTKTSRERHVMRALYSFFTFNNLVVFSLFSAVFSWVVGVVNASKGENAWKALTDSQPVSIIVSTLCNISPYWISWLMQRNLGAAVDLSQFVPLLWGSFSRRYRSPTPRHLIELTAPQGFDYAGYYNYYLFYATVAMAFAGIQPLVLPVTAFYFWIDAYYKKYMILYIFITKYESGGMFWRPVYNRVLFFTFLSNVVFALIIGGKSYQWSNRNELIALIPLPFIILGFKLYCSRTYDDQLHYYQTGNMIHDAELVPDAELKHGRKGDRVGVRFGHPVLYKPLITPMVSAKSQHLLKQVYAGRIAAEGAVDATQGFSDVYLDNMDERNPGKPRVGNAAPFEFVSEANLDFEHFKNRPEFRDQAGGDGELYGRAQDMIRPGTPGSSITGLTRVGTWDSDYSGHGQRDSRASGTFMGGIHSRSESGDSDITKVGGRAYPGGEGGVEYPRGYHQAGSTLRDQSPAGSDFEFRRQSALGMQNNDSRERLVSTAAGMGLSTPGVQGPTPGGYGPIRTGAGVHTPGSIDGEDDTSYDYFRRGRTGR